MLNLSLMKSGEYEKQKKKVSSPQEMNSVIGVLIRAFAQNLMTPW
jgi:hypothetical protein